MAVFAANGSLPLANGALFGAQMAHFVRNRLALLAIRLTSFAIRLNFVRNPLALLATPLAER